MFLLFEQKKKSSLQLYLPTTSLGQLIQEKHPSLVWVCKHRPPPPPPPSNQPRERCGPAGCWGGGLWNEGWARVYSEQGREGTLTLLIAQANLTVVTPLQSHWSVKMLFLQARLPLRNVVWWQLPSSLSPHSHRTRQGQFPPHLPPSRSRCLANQVPASFLFF